MPNLMPFRDYSEHEVINFFACNVVANKGTVVAPVRSWKDNNGTEGMTNGPVQLGTTGPGNLYTNSVTQNFDLVGTVTTLLNPSLVLGDQDIHGPAIGILLKDVREYDENGKKLVFDSRKAAEMDVVIKDIQAAPILTRGIVYINDVEVLGGDTVFPGDAVYLGSNGRLSSGYTAVAGTIPSVVVGKFLSKIDPASGYVLVKLNFN